MAFHIEYGKLRHPELIITCEYLYLCPCSDEKPDSVSRWDSRLQTLWKEIKSWRSYAGTLKERQTFENGNL